MILVKKYKNSRQEVITVTVANDPEVSEVQKQTVQVVAKGDEKEKKVVEKVEVEVSIETPDNTKDETNDVTLNIPSNDEQVVDEEQQKVTQVEEVEEVKETVEADSEENVTTEGEAIV